MQTAICTQRTEVLVLEMKHYERLVAKRNTRTIDMMMENLEVMVGSVKMHKHRVLSVDVGG